MTTNEIVRQLRNGLRVGITSDLIEQAADRLEELDERVAIISGEWISVKDRLPARNANVLWWCELRDRNMGHVRIGFYEGVTNHGIPEVSCCGPNCIPMYWMPMPTAPEPPEEGKAYVDKLMEVEK